MNPWKVQCTTAKFTDAVRAAACRLRTTQHTHRSGLYSVGNQGREHTEAALARARVQTARAPNRSTRATLCCWGNRTATRADPTLCRSPLKASRVVHRIGPIGGTSGLALVCFANGSGRPALLAASPSPLGSATQRQRSTLVAPRDGSKQAQNRFVPLGRGAPVFQPSPKRDVFYALERRGTRDVWSRVFSPNFRGGYRLPVPLTPLVDPRPFAATPYNSPAMQLFQDCLCPHTSDRLKQTAVRGATYTARAG